MKDVGIYTSPYIKENIGGKGKEMKIKITVSLIIILLFGTILFAESPTNNTPSTTPVASLTPVGNPVVITEYTVVSSKTSQIFHTLDCRYAANLNETNADYYATYQDAVAAGLRPDGGSACDPQPAPDGWDDPEDPEDPEDPNGIVIIPETFEPQQLFGINGVVIEADYCRRAIDPNDLSTRIIEPAIIMKKLGDVTSPTICSKCFEFNPETGEGNVPQEYVVPIYNPTPADVNVPEITHYQISTNMWIYVSDQSYNVHINDACEGLKSVPVYVVNMRNGLVAGSTAFWNPVKGIVEWRVTKFEAGDYQFVMNSDIGQTSLLAITICAKEIPKLEDFTANWLKGNFNLIKYADWISNREMWLQYLGRVSTITGNPITSGKIEWVFVDGAWKPVNAGANIISEIDADATIVDNQVIDRQTTTKETKIAPFEWRANEVKIVTTDTTTFSGYTAYTGRPPSGSTDYLNNPPFGAWEPLAGSTPAEIAAQEAAHIEEIGMTPPPEIVLPPQDFDAIMESADRIKNFEALPKEMRMEASTEIIDTYIAQKKAHEEYLAKKAVWDKEFKVKEEAWENKMYQEREASMWRERDMRMNSEMEHMERSAIAESIAQFYMMTVNQLNQTEKDMLLGMRRRVMNGDLSLSRANWDDIQAEMERIDSNARENIETPDNTEETETP